MKLTLRAVATAAVLTLAAFSLTGCADLDDDCDAAGPTAVSVEAAPAHFTTGKGPGSRSRSGASRHRSSSGKTKTHRPSHSHHDLFDDDCEDDD